MSQLKFIDHVRLCREARAKLIDSLDRREAQAQAGAERRNEPRDRYRATRVPIVLHQPGGTQIACLACARNLSSLGIAVIHASFVHDGTRCWLLLTDHAGAITLVPGTVRHCVHVEGRLHEVGIEFDDAIDPEEFTPAADQAIQELSLDIHVDGNVA